MRSYRFYCSPIKKPTATLSALESRHLSSVLRLGPGARVELFDGNGQLAEAVIKTIGPTGAVLEVTDIQTLPARSHGRIVIASAIAKGERFDRLIGMCVELGVDHICPILFERTVKQSSNPNIVQRWEKLSLAAAKQCRRLFLPRIDKPLPLPAALEAINNDYPQGQILLGDPKHNVPRLIDRKYDGSDVIGLVGPEGGLTDQEKTLLQRYHSQAVRLTDTILRVETAAVAFTSILTAQRYLGTISK